jgi:dTDP-glucose 4,6-dehydratase/UDP-glucose 4-epimerase
MRKILIIGSKGFIGSSCVSFFSGKNDVVGCDIVPDTSENYFQVHSGEELSKVISSSSFDICINASGSAHVGFSFQDPEMDGELNVTNVRRIIDALYEFNPACRLINFSSAAVYGNPDVLPVKEDSPLKPLSPYGQNKLIAEKLLANAAAEKGLRTCSLRVFSVYGPRLHKQIFWDIFQKSRKSNVVRLFGTGKESRDFIFIEDLLKAVECILDHADFRGEVYNVASGIETSIAYAAEIFLSRIDPALTTEFSGEIKTGDPMNWRADISKIAALGFVPGISLEEGLKRTAENYLAT